MKFVSYSGAGGLDTREIQALHVPHAVSQRLDYASHRVPYQLCSPRREFPASEPPEIAAATVPFLYI